MNYLLSRVNFWTWLFRPRLSYSTRLFFFLPQSNTVTLKSRWHGINSDLINMDKIGSGHVWFIHSPVVHSKISVKYWSGSDKGASQPINQSISEIWEGPTYLNHTFFLHLRSKSKYPKKYIAQQNSFFQVRFSVYRWRRSISGSLSFFLDFLFLL